jgi:hypothetical protein
VKEKCPICENGNADCNKKTSGDYHIYDCPNCGKFKVSGSVLRNSESESIGGDRVKASIISHTIRRQQRQGFLPELSTYSIESIIKNVSIPTPPQQADNFIIWLGNRIKDPGVFIPIEQDKIIAIIGAMSGKGIRFVMDSLSNKNLLELDMTRNKARLTINGWERFENLKRGIIFTRKAFMAMPFNDERLDRIYDECFKLAAYQAGFDLFRVDDKPEAGLIDDKIRVDIRTSIFLISELTNGNHGAYWEAGYAEGLGKPVIYTCDYDQKDNIHFDTKHCHTVFWKKDNLDEAIKDLKAVIRNTLPQEAKMED